MRFLFHADNIRNIRTIYIHSEIWTRGVQTHPNTWATLYAIRYRCVSRDGSLAGFEVLPLFRLLARFSAGCDLPMAIVSQWLQRSSAVVESCVPIGLKSNERLKCAAVVARLSCLRAHIIGVRVGYAN